MSAASRPMALPLTLSIILHLSALTLLFFWQPLWHATVLSPRPAQLLHVYVEEPSLAKTIVSEPHETSAPETSVQSVPAPSAPSPKPPQKTENLSVHPLNPTPPAVEAFPNPHTAILQENFSSPQSAQSAPHTQTQSGRVTGQANYFRAPKPTYPRNALRHGWQGTTVFRVDISENGEAIRVEILKSSGFAELDDAAREAAFAAKYVPEERDGQKVRCQCDGTISFILPAIR